MSKKEKIDGVTYSRVHQWVREKLGDPKYCSINKKHNGQIDWASISGKAKKDLGDYIPLCRSCHLKYDNKIRKARQLLENNMKETESNKRKEYKKMTKNNKKSTIASELGKRGGMKTYAKHGASHFRKIVKKRWEIEKAKKKVKQPQNPQNDEQN